MQEQVNDGGETRVQVCFGTCQPAHERAENEDYYDRDTDFTPFRLKV